MTIFTKTKLNLPFPVLVGKQKVPVTASTMYKNIIQEYCQKRHMVLPSYETKALAGKKFQSSVTVKEISYEGLPASNKKAAEMSAAEVAVKGLIGK